MASLREGLGLYRFTEGAYYRLESIDLGGDPESLPAKVEEAIRRGADLIAVVHPALLRALAGSRVRKPVVFGILGDPVACGVGPADDRHPPGLTGSYNPLHAYRVLALAKYYLPEARRVGLVFNGKDPLSVAHKDAMLRDSARVKLEVVAVGSEGEEGVPDAIERLFGQPVDAICLVVGLGRSCSTIIERARSARVPVFGFREDHVRAGALAAEVADVERVGVEAGRIMFQVLTGGDPSLLPYQRLIDTITLVNPGVAEQLAISLPPGALRSARVVGPTPDDPGQ